MRRHFSTVDFGGFLLTKDDLAGEESLKEKKGGPQGMRGKKAMGEKRESWDDRGQGSLNVRIHDLFTGGKLYG